MESSLDKSRLIFTSPALQPILDCVNDFTLFTKFKANDFIRLLFAEQHDGDAMRGEGTGQRGVAGKGFRAEQDIVGITVGVAAAQAGTGFEQGHQRLAIERVEGVLAIVKKVGGRTIRTI